MNKKILIPIIAIAVLLIGALAFLGIRLSQANKANEEMVQLFELEKEEMENEYSCVLNSCSRSCVLPRPAMLLRLPA